MTTNNRFSEILPVSVSFRLICMTSKSGSFSLMVGEVRRAQPSILVLSLVSISPRYTKIPVGISHHGLSDKTYIFAQKLIRLQEKSK